MHPTEPIERRTRVEPDRPYECRTCGGTYPVEHYVCPDCGGFSVER